MLKMLSTLLLLFSAYFVKVDCFTPYPGEIALWDTTTIPIAEAWVKNPSSEYPIGNAYDDDRNTYALSNGTDGWFMFKFSSERRLYAVTLKDGNSNAAMTNSSMGVYDTFDINQIDSFVFNDDHGYYPRTVPSEYRQLYNLWAKKSRYVSLRKTTQEKLAIADIAFYALKDEIPWDKLYYGCQKGYKPDTEVFEAKSLMDCLARCYHDKRYAIKIMNGSKCFCDKKLAPLLPSSACNTKCQEGDMFCGGTNAISVYGNGQDIGWPFNFNSEKLDWNPPKARSACYDGWTGDACHIKDCSFNNGLCGDHQCVEFSIGNANLAECQCTNNFARDKFYFNNCTLCEHGYELQGSSCVDINECANEDLCNSTTSNCTNNPGSFSCVCKPGFENLVNGTCEDINECEKNPCDPAISNGCVNTMGSFKCTCKEGYMNVEGPCKDKDECANDDLCNSKTSSCTNNPGSFSCVCKPGFENLVNGTCEDTNECEKNPCDSAVSSGCVNTMGSFECTCKEGFIKDKGLCKAPPPPTLSEGTTCACGLFSLVFPVFLFLWTSFFGN